MQSADPVFLVDDQSAVAGAEHSGGHYSLFVEAVVPARKAGAQSVAVAEERQPTVLTLMEAARREIDSGRPKAAAALLSEARSIDPANAQIARSMGVALAAAGELDAAEKSHREALALDPELAAARLHLGALLERRGNLRGAVSNYFRAISSAQARGRWLDASSTPHWLTSEVLHAMAMVNQNRVGLLMGLIEPLESRFGASAVQRVRAGLAHYLGHENHPPADPRQAPRFLHIPGLQPSPWLEPDLIDWLPALAERSEQIRQEAMDVFQQQADTGPFLRAPGGESLAPYLGGEQPRWDAFFFYRDGQESPSGAQLAPHTMAALRDVPLVRIKDHAPEICFSLLGPGSHIKPHYGVTNARVVVHLPLIVPEQCFLTVGGESRCWRYGRPWVFDDTFVHEAWNHSNETRVILLMDAWNPHLTEPERIAVTEIVEGIGEFNRCD
jgi:aspartate beta-hydroxylase